MNKRLGIVFVPLILAGCMGSTRPDWVQNRGTAYLKDSAFYGVGETSGIQNKILAQMTAGAVARSRVEQQVDAYAVALMKAYKDSLSPEALKKIEATQNLAFTFRTYVVIAMFDATVDHSWTDTEKDTVYVLVKLKLKRFTEKILDTEEADHALRQFVRNNAQATFDQMVQQEKKT